MNVWITIPVTGNLLLLILMMLLLLLLLICYFFFFCLSYYCYHYYYYYYYYYYFIVRKIKLKISDIPGIIIINTTKLKINNTIFSKTRAIKTKTTITTTTTTNHHFISSRSSLNDRKWKLFHHFNYSKWIFLSFWRNNNKSCTTY